MINVEEWINESKEIRTKHLAIEEPCIERGGMSTAHRGILAQYLNTNIPPKIDLCHFCGNALCSNPRHLYWGTRKENFHDMKMHGTFLTIWEQTVKKHGEDRAHQIWRHKRINSPIV